MPLCWDVVVSTCGATGYMETTRIVIGQLCLLCVFDNIFPLLVEFVDREDIMEQVEKKVLDNPPFQ